MEDLLNNKSLPTVLTPIYLARNPPMFKSLFLVLFLIGSMAAPAAAQVVINEISNDRDNGDNTGTSEPDGEFVELYNAGSSAVDIGNWTVDSRDPFAPAPGYTIPIGTMLAPGDFYVIGSATVPNVDLTPLPRPMTGLSTQDQGYWEDRNETFELRDASGSLQDAFFTEANKGGISGPADVISDIGGGWWGNTSLGVDGPGSGVSTGRWRDGLDTNVNGADFGLFRPTPGASNDLPLVAKHTVPDNDSLALGSVEAGGYTGSYQGATVIDPTMPMGLNNPTAIPASPQGGNAYSIVDNPGGTMVASNELVRSYEIYAYLETAFEPGGESESTMYGIGTTGTNFNRPGPDVPGANPGFTNTQINGSTGLAWLLERANNRTDLMLVQAGDGQSNGSWDVLAFYRLDNLDADWAKLSIDLDAREASFEGLGFNEVLDLDNLPDITDPDTGLPIPVTASVDTDYLGTFYVGFNSSPLSPLPGITRPATWDSVSTTAVRVIPEPSVLATVLLLGLGAACGRRRR